MSIRKNMHLPHILERFHTLPDNANLERAKRDSRALHQRKLLTRALVVDLVRSLGITKDRNGGLRMTLTMDSGEVEEISGNDLDSVISATTARVTALLFPIINRSRAKKGKGTHLNPAR